MPFRKEKKIPFYMQNLNKIFSLLLHLPRVWRPLPAVERLHNHFPTQKTVTTSPGSWHHSKPSSLRNITESVSELVSDKHNQWSDLGPIKTAFLRMFFWILMLLFALDKPVLPLWAHNRTFQTESPAHYVAVSVFVSSRRPKSVHGEGKLRTLQ